MSDFTVCNVCEEPGIFKNSTEVNQIYCNVRRLKKDKFTVWRCSSCNSLHCKEEVDLDYYYKHYPVHHVLREQELPSTTSYIARPALYNRLQLLHKQGFKKEHKLLDYGCGNGLFISFLQKMGYKNVFGYDPYSPKYSSKEVLGEKYDVITSQDVIEHIDVPAELLKQFVGSLKEGGLLVVGTPNANEINLLAPKDDSTVLHQPYHRHILSEKALLNLGLNQGLNVVDVYKRCYVDTLYPFVNSRFFYSYIRRAGDVIDVIFDEPRLDLILASPLLLFYAFTGYFFPHRGNMMIFFRA